MSHIRPGDSNLLTDMDVDYAHFRCCGDEDLVFLRCQHCGHIWVDCYECNTWYVNLDDLSQTTGSFLSDVSERLACPSCQRQFADFFYLMSEHVDAYLPTADQVIRAGFGRFLSPELRRTHGIA